MKKSEAIEVDDGDVSLNVFCQVESDAFRVHVPPAMLPRHLEHCFDRHGEAYPAYLDFDDLDERMKARGVPYEKRVARTGSIELTARGHAAVVLAVWLSAAFASGIRPAATKAPE